MVFKKTVIRITALLMSVLGILTLCSCGQTVSVMLCDYQSIQIPEEEYTVSAEDLSFAILMKLMELDVTTEKKINKTTVEETDVIGLSITGNGVKEDKVRMVVGDAEISEELDTALLGKKLNETVTFTVNGTDRKAQIISIECFADRITDDIAKTYFGCTTAAEAEAVIRKEIEDHRKFDYAYQVLISASQVRSYDPAREEYVESVFDHLGRVASENESTVEEYINETFDCTEDEYRQYINCFYDEYLILNAFSERERITVSNDEIETCTEELISEMGVSREEFDGLYGEEYVCYSIWYEQAYDVLLKYL